MEDLELKIILWTMKGLSTSGAWIDVFESYKLVVSPYHDKDDNTDG